MSFTSKVGLLRTLVGFQACIAYSECTLTTALCDDMAAFSFLVGVTVHLLPRLWRSFFSQQFQSVVHHDLIYCRVLFHMSKRYFAISLAPEAAVQL